MRLSVSRRLGARRKRTGRDRFATARSTSKKFKFWNSNPLIICLAPRRIIANNGEEVSLGTYRQSWDGRNNRGLMVSSGVYFYKLVAGDAFTDVRKMILMK